MVVSEHSPELSKTAFGLLLVFNSMNLRLFVANLLLVLVVFLPALKPTWIPGALMLAFVLMFLDQTFSVLGMACCVAAPVGPGFRVVAVGAFGLTALSLIVTLGLFLPQLLRQVLGGDATDPTPAWSIALLLGSLAQVLFLAFLWRLARMVRRRTLVLWPLLLVPAVLLLGIAGGAVSLALGIGAAIGLLWIGSSLLLSAHAYYLLLLRQAVLEFAGEPIA